MNLSDFSLQLEWHPIHLLTQEEQLCEKEKSWLMSRDSLTQRLKQQGCLSVEVLFESWVVSMNNKVWQRDVLLLINQQAWVFARTLIPQSLLAELPFEIYSLGKTPLGEHLFHHRHIQHSQLRFTSLSKAAQKKLLPTEYHANESSTIWGRSREFIYQNQNFSIFEFFLDHAQNTLRKEG